MKLQCENNFEVAHSDEPTEIYHLDLHLPLSLWSFTVNFCSLFSCLAATFLFCFTFTFL